MSASVAPTANRATQANVVAAVDLGSNSFHMVIARNDLGKLRVLDKMRERVRLAAGLDGEHLVSPSAQRRAIRCLERFGERLHDLSADQVRVVGTNTLRSARNADEFLPKLRRAIGHPIDIISGREEARLIYLGVPQNIKNLALRRRGGADRASQQRSRLALDEVAADRLAGGGLVAERTHHVVAHLEGVAERQARSFVGRCRKDHGDGAVLSLVGMLMRLSGAPQSKGGSTPASDDPRFLRAVDYIEATLAEDLRMVKIGAAVGMSESSVARMFRKALRCTVLQYVQRRRIARAAELLRTSKMPVIEIAASVGYDNPQYFATLFRGLMGTSPTAYRRGFRS